MVLSISDLYIWNVLLNLHMLVYISELAPLAFGSKERGLQRTLSPRLERLAEGLGELYWEEVLPLSKLLWNFLQCLSPERG